MNKPCPDDLISMQGIHALQQMISHALACSPAQAMMDAARQHQNQLLKPQNSLGRLEDLAVWLAGLQNKRHPRLEKRQAVVFAANHGVVINHPSLSAFPPEITALMVESFRNKTAAINQLCRLYKVDLYVHAFDLQTPSADYTLAPALEEQSLLAAIKQGANTVKPESHVLCLGEMGIGNTTSAAAIAYALYGLLDDHPNPQKWCGKGTGIDLQSWNEKCTIVQHAINRHLPILSACSPQLRPWLVLLCLGGFEFAGLVGAILKAREHLIPVMIDGFACTTAAAILHAINPKLTSHLCISHQSEEYGHAPLLQSLSLQPLLSLNMRLGEATGAVLALSLLDAALACHNGMDSLPSKISHR